jgi:hypothetical protein
MQSVLLLTSQQQSSSAANANRDLPQHQQLTPTKEETCNDDPYQLQQIFQSWLHHLNSFFFESFGLMIKEVDLQYEFAKLSIHLFVECLELHRLLSLSLRISHVRSKNELMCSYVVVRACERYI